MSTAVDHQLVRFEFWRAWRHPLVWITAALTVLLVSRLGFGYSDHWAGEKYTLVVHLSSMPMYIGAFLVGAMSANRDAGRPLAPAASVDVGRRTTGRLGSIAPAVILTAITMIVIAVAARVGGGFLLGEGHWSTTSFQPPLVDLLQAPLLTAAFGTLGVLLGRVIQSKLAIIAIAAALLFGFILFSWAWQWFPAAPLRVMPLEIDVRDFDPARVPPSWHMLGPDQFSHFWRRQLVHEPTIIGHDIYLAGLATAFAGFAVRTGRVARRVAVFGIAAAVAGIVIQVLVDPS